MPRAAIFLLLSSSLLACQFDAGGPGLRGDGGLPADIGILLADKGMHDTRLDSSDGGPGDSDLTEPIDSNADLSVADLYIDQTSVDLSSDLGTDLQHDLPALPQGVTTGALSDALQAARVPCVLSDGTTRSFEIPIVDRPLVVFFDGSLTLASAPTSTQSWAGTGPSVSVLFDVNTCGDEELPGDSDWVSAGLLIRGAWLDAGALRLAAGTTIADINLFDISSSGGWESEFARPDDAGLNNFPQLVAPVTRAKEEILRLGLP